MHRRHDIPLDFLDVARQIACHGNSKDLWTMYALKTPAGPEKTPAGPEKNARACHTRPRAFIFTSPPVVHRLFAGRDHADEAVSG